MDKSAEFKHVNYVRRMSVLTFSLFNIIIILLGFEHKFLKHGQGEESLTSHHCHVVIPRTRNILYRLKGSVYVSMPVIVGRNRYLRSKMHFILSLLTWGSFTQLVQVILRYLNWFYDGQYRPFKNDNRLVPFWEVLNT